MKYVKRIEFQERPLVGPHGENAIYVHYAERCPTCGHDHQQGSRGVAIKPNCTLEEAVASLRELASWVEQTP